MVKTMDCEIVVSEFELQLRYYVHFRANTLGKGMNPFMFPAMGLIVPLLFFKENGFSDVPLIIKTPHLRSYNELNDSMIWFKHFSSIFGRDSLWRSR